MAKFLLKRWKLELKLQFFSVTYPNSHFFVFSFPTLRTFKAWPVEKNHPVWTSFQAEEDPKDEIVANWARRRRRVLPGQSQTAHWCDMPATLRQQKPDTRQVHRNACCKKRTALCWSSGSHRTTNYFFFKFSVQKKPNSKDQAITWSGPCLGSKSLDSDWAPTLSLNRWKIVWLQSVVCEKLSGVWVLPPPTRCSGRQHQHLAGGTGEGGFLIVSSEHCFF